MKAAASVEPFTLALRRYTGKSTLMIKILLRITFLLLFGTGLILLVEHFDARHQTRLLNEQAAQQLHQIGDQLQQQFDELVSDNEQLAKDLSADQEWLKNNLQKHPIVRRLEANPTGRTLTFTRELKIMAAFPLQGNEVVMGINYSLSPEFMPGIRRALASGETIINSKAILRQNHQPGFIVRTPYYAAGSGQFLGLVTTAVDLQAWLREAGWKPEEADFDFLIEAHNPRQEELGILGEAESFHRSTIATQVRISENGHWELRANRHQSGYSTARSDVIRLSGAALMIGLVVLLLYRNGLLTQAPRHGRGMTLHTSAVLVVVVPIILLVGVIAWLSFSATQATAERLMYQQATDLGRQLRARVEALLDVPRQAAFDVELFRNGVLDPERPEDMLSIFLAQLRVQPQLTFLSMANAQGEYYAASRPPAGTDRNVRLQFATLATNREMRVHWVGEEGNTPSAEYIRGNSYFDARETLWYQQALKQSGLRWYPVYRYNTLDMRNQYRGLGIGMSSAVYDAENRFLGVISADVALQQISDFLKKRTSHLDRLIFLVEENGDLLATSDDSAIYQLGEGAETRINMRDSSNPMIRVAGAVITQEGRGAGSRFIKVDGKKHLLDWQTIRLPDGPHMLFATVLPQSWVSNSAWPVLRDVLYLTALFVSFGILGVLYLLAWMTRPLLRLEAWARQLGRGHWEAPLPPASPIREINSLSHTLGIMASQLRNHAGELEQRVASRTQELAIANQKLAQLSLTDSLTGIPNRRRFDEFIRNEWQRAQRTGDSLALLLCDVDNFKLYNDHYGHAAGDQVLVKVAQELDQQVGRAGDLLCRYGGEEFAVVLTRTDLPAALTLAEKLRAGVNGLGIEHCHVKSGYLSISIGVTAAIPTVETSLQAFFDAADAALYQAKKQGRNRVCSD